MPATLAATRYEAADRRLGEPLAGHVSTEVRLSLAQRNAEKTVKAINKVLADNEAELITTAYSGGALQESDPRKTGLLPQPQPRPANPSSSDNKLPTNPCSTCGKMHWHADCPERRYVRMDKFNKQKEKDRRAAAVAKPA